ncbi:hypothetical protein HPB48_010157 [Haemaphysalis longicornis]|uniref:Uncharacterized protein n=1 Tax=Haemaphysalis longicornis TaxID=44386 RepID=A0A9J6FVU0_HAELO|nr:hypothetical protein HPB48_010157 [Haemaphysalis longicornis]
MCRGRWTAVTSSAAVAAALAALWLGAVQAGGQPGSQDGGLLRQGNSAWHPAAGPFDNPWTSPHPVAAQGRGKAALDVQTLTNIVNVARYILCECPHSCPPRQACTRMRRLLTHMCMACLQPRRMRNSRRSLTPAKEKSVSDPVLPLI